MRRVETSRYWRHPSFPDLGLLQARFTRHRYEMHTHPTYVIALVTAGCERIRIGRRTVLAPAGTVAVVNPEEWHDGERGVDEGWSYRTFYPSVALMTRLAGELGLDQPPLFAPATIADGILASALAAAHEGSASQDATEAEATLLAALQRLIVGHGGARPRSGALDRSGSAARYALYRDLVEAELGSRLALQRLADAAGVTRFQVIRDFKKVIGLTPAAYIRDRRLRRAGALIEQGSGLADAAVAAGFADQSHLSRSFRAAHGMTPGMFRNAG